MLWGFIYVATFLVVFVASVIFKMTYDPTHGKYKKEYQGLENDLGIFFVAV